MKDFDLNVLMSMIGNAIGGTVKEYCKGIISPIEEKNEELKNKVNCLKREIEDIKKTKNDVKEENKELKNKNNKLEKEYENIIKESSQILDENKELKNKNNKLREEYKCLVRDNEALNKLNNQNKIKLANLSKYDIIALNEEIFKIMVTEYRNERNDSNRKKKIVSNLKHIIDDNDWKIKKENINTLVDTKGRCAIFTEEQCEIIKRAMGRI